MSIFPSMLPDPDLAGVLRRFPDHAGPLLEVHDRILRDPSPLIAAYVSALNCARRSPLTRAPPPGCSRARRGASTLKRRFERLFARTARFRPRFADLAPDQHPHTPDALPLAGRIAALAALEEDAFEPHIANSTRTPRAALRG